MRVDIDPKVDFAFRWVFGKEQNLHLLKSLLNAVLNFSSKIEVSSLTLLDLSNIKDGANDKLSILDVKARDSTGRQFDVEMQLLSERAFTNRILYYWANLHRQQLEEGDFYTKLQPTIAVCFADFLLFQAADEYCLSFEMRNEKYGIKLNDDILIIILELPKFNKPAEQLTSQLDQWLYFLRNAAELDSEKIPGNLNNPEICKAIEALVMLNQDDVERMRYQARQKALMDERSRLHSAHLDGLEEGLKKGREEGREQGREEGRVQGRDEGRQEGREQGREDGYRQALVEVIYLCQKNLGIAISSEESLNKLTIDELKKLLQTLQGEPPKSK